LSEIPEEDFYFAISNLMIFYKGSVTYRELETMPLPEFLQLQANAFKVKDQIDRETEKQMKRQKNG
jgi:hypothetical protein